MWQRTARCWLLPWPALAPPAPIRRAKPSLEGTRRERQMVPARKTLAQLWVIYVVLKVLLCILYSLLSFTLLLSLCQLPCTKPFAFPPCPWREDGGCLSCALLGSTLPNCIPRHRAGVGQLHLGGNISSCAAPCRAALLAHPHAGSRLGRPNGSTCWGWGCRNQVMGKLRDVLKTVTDRQICCQL